MFDRTLLIARRTVALVAVTIVLGMAARTASALALGPQHTPAPRVATPYQPAITTAATRAGRELWSRRVANSTTVATRCSARRLAPARTRPASTRTRLRAAA